MGISHLSRMAQSTKTQPSIEEIFRILARIPENKLLKFKHKLNCIRQDRKSCQLLQAMILLTLRRDTDARISLDALGDDATAAHIYRIHTDGAKAGNPNSLSPEQEAAVALTVAQIYSLLAGEQLCDPQARVEAYRVAIKTAQASNSVNGAKLDSLIEEAQRKCGMELDFPEMNNDFSPLRSVAGKLTVPITRSYSQPIRNVSVSPDPQPLRSTDTLDSLASHLEISQSPTVVLRTHSVHQPDISESSKSPLAENGEGKDSLKLPASCLTKSPTSFSAQGDPKSSLLVSPDLRAEPPLEERVNHPVECTEPQTLKGGELQDHEGSTPSHLDDSSTQQPGSDTEQCISPCIDASSPAHKTNSRPISLDSHPPPPGTILTDPEYNKTEFFTFVILHADEDEPIACRVKDRLNDMGISNGATFSENFLVPGRCQFSCFQNALDNSAFTLLLLTENFKCRLCAYQTSVALWDSFKSFLKNNSVIPFVPKENPIRKMPLMLSTLVPLIENSPLFATKVKNTFTADSIEAKRRQWNSMRERQEKYQNYLVAQRLPEMNIAGCPTQMPFPLPSMGFPGLQHASPGYIPETFLRPTFPAPEMPQTQPFQSQPFAVSLGPTSLTPGGPQPHLIIQNAQMVQIGDYNQMQVERTKTALCTAAQEVDSNQVLEAETAGQRTEG